jgi:hypothetical protein
MKKTIFPLLIAIGFISSSWGQTSFFDNFTGSSSNLIVPNDYVILNGKIGATGARLDYITTQLSNFNEYNFEFNITVNLGNSNGDLAWIGLGSGRADPNWWYQPEYAGYIDIAPATFGGGGASLSAETIPSLTAVAVSEGTAVWNNTILANSTPFGDTVRVSVTKISDTLQFQIDPNYTGTSFNPAYTGQLSISQDLPFLNSTNSSLFFGAGAGTTFSDLSVSTAVPEPSTYALFGIGAIGMLMVMRRKKTA